MLFQFRAVRFDIRPADHISEISSFTIDPELHSVGYFVAMPMLLIIHFLSSSIARHIQICSGNAKLFAREKNRVTTARIERKRCWGPLWELLRAKNWRESGGRTQELSPRDERRRFMSSWAKVSACMRLEGSFVRPLVGTAGWRVGGRRRRGLLSREWGEGGLGGDRTMRWGEASFCANEARLNLKGKSPFLQFLRRYYQRYMLLHS